MTDQPKHNPFVHLHLHTEFSLLDAANRVGELMPHIQKLGMDAVAMTDHGNMFGALQFYQEALKHKVKPILGCEMYLAEGSRFHKEKVDDRRQRTHHLVLLAETKEGYQNLTRLVSIGYQEGFYGRPRIDKEVLRQYSKGLICTSACLSSELAFWLQQGDPAMARKVAEEHATLFGDNNYFLEIMDHGIPEQHTVLEGIRQLANEVGLPYVVTNDAHYLVQSDSKPHDILQCVQGGKSIHDTQRKRYHGEEFYVKSPKQMWDAYGRDFAEGLKNTAWIAERCNVEFDLSGKTYHMPDYPVPQGETLDSYFARLSHEGLDARLGELGITDADKQQEYRERLDYEIKVIQGMGFPGYFLIVWDFVDYAKRHDIPVGPGRGSAAGSLVAYSLRITDIDPIQFNLLFERFLNPERISMPDIDIDFCQDRRDEVMHYVRDHYGAERVCQIITFNTMGAKSIIKDVGRALDVPYEKTNQVTKLIPSKAGVGVSLEQALKEEPELRKLADADPLIKEVIDYSLRLEGLPRHVSVHAAGVVITKEPLTNYLPLFQKPDTDVVTQFPMDDVEKLGLLKMDFLGLRTLTVIKNAVDMINRDLGKGLKIGSIPLDDRKTLALLGKGQTVGIFQFESSGMRDMLSKCGVDRFEDLIALNAMYRPGPMGNIPSYIARKHGREKPVYIDHRLRPILEETYGIMVYQEQVMKIANVLAGYTLGQADELRKAMGKKKADLIAKHRDIFVEGAVKNGVPNNIAEDLYDQMAAFGSYGFNKSHAAAYSFVAFQTAYLKAHYPHYFMAAMLNSFLDKTEMVVQYINECRDMGIEVLPPHINTCHPGFTVHDNKIYFGLGAVKGAGMSAIERIITAREEGGPFTSIFDLCERVEVGSLNRKILESLIKAGALDGLGASRAQMIEVIDLATDIMSRKKKDEDSGQASLLDMFGSATQETVSIAVDYPDIREFSQRKLLELEKEALGFYVSGHPLRDFERLLKQYTTTTQTLRELPDRAAVKIPGLITKLERKTDKRGKRYGLITLEDLLGVTTVRLNQEQLEELGVRELEDQAVLIEGAVSVWDDGSMTVRATKLPTPLLDLRGKCRNLAISVPLITVDESRMKQLNRVFDKFPGECAVKWYFLVPRASTGEVYRVIVPDTRRVKPDEPFVQEVSSLIGDRNIEFLQ